MPPAVKNQIMCTVCLLGNVSKTAVSGRFALRVNAGAVSQQQTSAILAS
jgi:hypothetical protein